MSISLADLRFQWQRMQGLLRRGLASLRARGWQATLQRVKHQFKRAPALRTASLYFPQAGPFAPFAVPDSVAPTASIVIPVYNQVAHTLACLRALAEHPPLAKCEILIVDDGSSDLTQEWMSQIQGLHFHRRPINGGFIAACNDGAARASGEFLVFLNNDTVPQPGWLDALLDTFTEHPDTGLAGAQLLYPDGRLQEAGGVVFSDGSAWNYGRFDCPDDPRFASLREADYCSGAAIAIPRAFFASLGGFDVRYSPAYYEDTDLAFSVRAAGRRVLYQPKSRVVHLEGITSGTDTGSGAKAYQVRNRGIFAGKWQDSLKLQPLPGTIPSPRVLHRSQRQILIIDALTPRPDQDSGSLRMWNLMRLLCQEGAHVVFYPANRMQDGEYSRSLQAMGVEVWHAPFAKRFPAWLKEHGSRFDAILLSRYYVAHDLLPLVKQHAPKAKLVFDSVDLHYLREMRQAKVSSDSSLQRQAIRTRARELSVIAKADLTFVVSKVEQQLLQTDAPLASVELLSNLHELVSNTHSFDMRKDLVFVGGFRHTPNVDAMQWFLADVWPDVLRRLPGVAFHCIGSDPPASLLALGQAAGVQVHGHVPDLDPAMNGMRIAVAPLRFGAGVKGKVNLSMAHGQPVVATTCAVEGMHLQDGVDVLVADDAQAFADAVVRLYQDQALWERLSHNGLENVQRHFSMAAAHDVVRRVFFDAP